MKIIFILFPFLFLNACGGSSWLKQHTTGKEIVSQTQTIQTQKEEAPQSVVLEQKTEETKTKTSVKEEASAPKVSVKETKTSTSTQNTKEEKTKEEPQKPVNENEQIFLTSENRLAHPWYYAKETPPAENKPKWFGEELKFDISWSFITAGKAQLISSKMVEANGQKMYQFEAYAQSYPVIDAMFKVRDINMSWIAEDLSRSTGYWQSVKEGSYARDEWLIF
ncbi:MAG: DUF3108 domain-containing protein, partial [Elusimicrobiaceae bacterium]|nr:DUF3108 domain-containing protein [Elusimicrobiaceae bacterium]